MATSLRSISRLRSGFVALLLAGGACADDTQPITTTSDSDTEAGTSTGPVVTTVTMTDPDSTGGSVGMDSTEGMTTGPGTDSSTSGDTSTTGTAECGNGVIEAGEDCESEDLGGADCTTAGFTGGVLLCTAECTFDTEQCTNSECGNDVVEDTEQCDGTDLGAADCLSEGFDGGTLGCAADCTAYDTSACTTITCGDGVLDAGETCDGAALNGEDCLTQGFDAGALGCAADCQSYDTTGCSNVSCAHDICVTGVLLDPACDPCVDQICAADEFCCLDQWDGQCVDQVASVCGIVCPTVCGDAAIDAGEVCDGAALGGETCITQGFAGNGVLACAADCLGYDTAGCSAVGGGDCCAAHATNGCDDAACEASVCAGDAFCCNTTWDATCANAALANANCLGAGGSCLAPGACSDQDIGSATGAAVASGNTTGDDEDLDASCAGGNALDHVMEWTAPAAGLYTFDTNGSAYDTALALYSDCATEIACDDDSGTGTQSLVTRNMAAGETIYISVDGFNGLVGAWVLNITAPPVCGDGAIVAPEVCDGANLNGQTCVAQGFGGGGVLACAADCNSFNTAGCMGMLACQDADLGSALGNNVAAGTTVGEDNDLDATCGFGDPADRVFRWVAPAAGQYTFNTNGSMYDTVLALYSDCATQLQCDDDSGTDTQSLLSRNLAAGQVVLIVVDGFNTQTGNYILNITSP